MHTPESSKHKLEESFLIEIYEVVQKSFEVCQKFAITYGEKKQHKHDILILK